MTVNDLYKIIEKENYDSEIIALTVVVRDSLSNELTVYSLEGYGGLTSFNKQ